MNMNIKKKNGKNYKYRYKKTIIRKYKYKEMMKKI